MNKRSKVDNAIKQLLEIGVLQAEDSKTIETIKPVIKQFTFQISPEMAAIIDHKNSDDPIVKQFIPSISELDFAPNEHDDPIGDKAYTKIKGIVHRYPDRCLLMPVQVCPVYCRFCFRRETVGSHAETLNANEMQDAIDYIAQNKSIWEVILTGGDPLILKPKTLQKIIQSLAEIPHIEIIRIHTRVPLVTPKRINTELLTALQSHKTLYIVLHANHANEFTEQGIAACKAINAAGFPMLSQTTLLKNINDDIHSLSTLMRCFVKNRIKPYYLHHPDLAKGTHHFRVSIKRGQRLMKQLRGQLSGLCQPTYVLDIPGGHGKMPIGPDYLREVGENYHIEDYLGDTHIYLESIKTPD